MSEDDAENGDMAGGCPVRPPHDDDTLDAIALVNAVRSDDTEAVAAIVSSADLLNVSLVLARLLAVVSEESNACPGHFRRWAADAAVRRT